MVLRIKLLQILIASFAFSFSFFTGLSVVNAVQFEDLDLTGKVVVESENITPNLKIPDIEPVVKKIERTKCRISPPLKTQPVVIWIQ